MNKTVPWEVKLCTEPWACLWPILEEPLPAAEARLPLGLWAPDFKGLNEVDLHSPILSFVSGE